jgi:hypothetical protein
VAGVGIGMARRRRMESDAVQSVGRSVGQSISQSDRQSVSQSVNKPVSPSVSCCGESDGNAPAADVPSGGAGLRGPAARTGLVLAW